jgi:hypothetical protein
VALAVSCKAEQRERCPVLPPSLIIFDVLPLSGITSGETSLPSGKKTMRERMGEVNLEKGRKAKLRPSKRAKRSDGPDVEAS